MNSFFKSLIVNFTEKFVKKSIPSWKLDKYISFIDALEKGEEK